MYIGGQQNLITIQRRVQVGVNKLNEPNYTWQDWRPDVFCQVTVKRGKEQFDPTSRQRYSEEVWQFRTRFDEVVGVDDSMRVLHEGSNFDIKAILPDGQKRVDCIIECTISDIQLQKKPLGLAIMTMINDGVIDEEYEGFTVEVTGGEIPYVISAEGLPPGLTINAVTGEVSGTPTLVGDFVAIIKVTDNAGIVETLPEFPISIEAD